MIHPAPALVVRADTSIEDCVRLMKKHDIGSVLIVSDDGKEQLVGIFTERDLLRKIDLIHPGAHWGRPVRAVMTKPVRTVEIRELANAPSVMIQNGIRHLPVVAPKRDGGRILGMVSMRDFFRQWASRERPGPVGLRKEFAVSVLSRDPSVHELLGSAHALLDRKSELRALTGLDRLDEQRDPDLLVIDIDGYPPKAWVSALREAIFIRKGRLTVVVFNPAAHSAKAVEMLEALSAKGAIGAFAKPVNLFTFSALLRGD